MSYVVYHHHLIRTILKCPRDSFSVPRVTKKCSSCVWRTPPSGAAHVDSGGACGRHRGGCGWDTPLQPSTGTKHPRAPLCCLRRHPAPRLFLWRNGMRVGVLLPAFQKGSRSFSRGSSSPARTRGERPGPEHPAGLPFGCRWFISSGRQIQLGISTFPLTGRPAADTLGFPSPPRGLWWELWARCRRPATF